MQARNTDWQCFFTTRHHCYQSSPQSMSRSAVISDCAADKFSHNTAKFARVATSGFEVFPSRYTHLTFLWPTFCNGFPPSNFALQIGRFLPATVNGRQRRKDSNQWCGLEDVMSKVSKPHMMFFQPCTVHFWLRAEVIPEVLMKPHKRCRWLLDDVEDTSQNQQVKQHCYDANHPVCLTNILAICVAIDVGFGPVGVATSDPYPGGARNSKPHAPTAHDCQQVLDKEEKAHTSENVVALATNVQIKVERWKSEADTLCKDDAQATKHFTTVVQTWCHQGHIQGTGNVPSSFFHHLRSEQMFHNFFLVANLGWKIGWWQPQQR